MENQKKPENQVSWLPIGMCLGVSIGMAIGAAADNIPLGMSIGVSIGVGIGALIDHKNRTNSEDEKE